VGLGKSTDILFKIKPFHKLIILDIAKDACQSLLGQNNDKNSNSNSTSNNYSTNYGSNDLFSVIEDLKNGVFESNKYHPETRFLNETPHVVVFANDWPEFNRLSLDRWVLWELVDEE
jgi:hypothetical protein